MRDARGHDELTVLRARRGFAVESPEFYCWDEDAEEVIDKPSREQNQTPDEAAKARMRELAADLVKGSGQTVGLPRLRAGSKLEIDGVGARFSGIYEVTKTTHAIGASGYTTSFEARKEIFT